MEDLHHLRSTERVIRAIALGKPCRDAYSCPSQVLLT